MELNFIGRGSAFNTKEGNNSSYFIENDELFLIDCGEDIFERIKEFDILKNINKINLFITHTHSDHVGSIGSLISNSNKEVNIIVPEDEEFVKNIEKLIGIFEVSDKCTIVKDKELNKKYNSFNEVKYNKEQHSNVISYGLIFNTNKGKVYYTGDTHSTSTIEELISADDFDKIYVDTNDDPIASNAHVGIDRLTSIVPEEKRAQVYCMHVNSDSCIKTAKDRGFNVVDIKEKAKSTGDQIDNSEYYYIENGELYISKCGENTFEYLQHSNLINEVNKVNIFITDFHSNHVGSLGSLLLFAYWALKKEINIIVTNKEENVRKVSELTDIYGSSGTYSIYKYEDFFDKKNNLDKELKR